MEENISATPPAQLGKPEVTRDFKPFLIFGLVVVILSLLGGIVFFDQIKSAFTRRSLGKGRPITQQTAQKPLTSPTSFPTINPKIVCARFTDLESALLNIDKACALDLSNQNLTSLPDKVVQLAKLNEITLNNNSLAIFPKALTSIQTLFEIDLANNKISEIPSSISLLTNLQKIDLSNNKLQSLPQEIGKLHSLNNLILAGNNFSSSEIEKIKTTLPQTTITF